jgi:hypothetical protein
MWTAIDSIQRWDTATQLQTIANEQHRAAVLRHLDGGGTLHFHPPGALANVPATNPDGERLLPVSASLPLGQVLYALRGLIGRRNERCAAAREAVGSFDPAMVATWQQCQTRIQALMRPPFFTA